MNLSTRARVGALAVALAATGAGAVALAVPAAAAVGCQVTYTTNDWTSSPGPGRLHRATWTVKNLGDPINGWTLRFSFPGTQLLTQGWSATWSQSGAAVTATNLSWNASLATGGSTQIGFNASWTGSNPKPTSFTLNGVACTGSTTTPPTTTPPPTTPPAHHATADDPATVDDHTAAHQHQPTAGRQRPRAARLG